MSTATKITTRDWAAWVNLMPPLPTPGGTLHVTGEVDTHSTKFAFLKRAEPQGINPKILILDLMVQAGIVPAKNPQRVHYTEALKEKQQYTSVEIRYEGKVIAEIDHIEEVH